MQNCSLINMFLTIFEHFLNTLHLHFVSVGECIIDIVWVHLLYYCTRTILRVLYWSINILYFYSTPLRWYDSYSYKLLCTLRFWIQIKKAKKIYLLFSNIIYNLDNITLRSAILLHLFYFSPVKYILMATHLYFYLSTSLMKVFEGTFTMYSTWWLCYIYMISRE